MASSSFVLLNDPGKLSQTDKPIHIDGRMSFGSGRNAAREKIASGRAWAFWAVSGSGRRSRNLAPSTTFPTGVMIRGDNTEQQTDHESVSNHFRQHWEFDVVTGSESD